jgi:CRISPR-associated endonuclease Csn1
MLPPFPLLNPEKRFNDGEKVKNEFRARVANSISKIIVSHKPDHGKEGALHEETAYGREKFADGSYGDLFVHKRENGKRELKIVKEANPIPICKKGEVEPYKWFASGSNYCVDIVDNNGKCIMEGITTFNANQKEFVEKWKKTYPDAKLVVRLHKSDILLYDGIYYVISKLDPNNGRLYGVQINDARDSKNRDDKNIGKTALFKKEAKHVVVDVLGNVHPAKKVK